MLPMEGSMSQKKSSVPVEPLTKGYQPSPQKVPTGDKVQGGYQPTTSEQTPVNPPPKKP